MNVPYNSIFKRHVVGSIFPDLRIVDFEIMQGTKRIHKAIPDEEIEECDREVLREQKQVFHKPANRTVNQFFSKCTALNLTTCLNCHALVSSASGNYSIGSHQGSKKCRTNSAK